MLPERIPSNVMVVGKSSLDVTVHPTGRRTGEKHEANMTLEPGGNGGNVAVGLAKLLNISPELWPPLGNDFLAPSFAENLRRSGVRIDIDEKGPESCLSVILDPNKPDRKLYSGHPPLPDPTIFTPRGQNLGSPDLLFATSMGNEWRQYYNHVLDYVEASGTPFAFSPGSREMNNVDDPTFNRALGAADIVLVNSVEAKKILGIDEEVQVPVSTLLMFLKNKMINEDKNVDLHPDKKRIVSITDSIRGAWAMDQDNNMYSISVFSQQISPIWDEHVYETGAGDAYVVGFLGAQLLGLPIEDSMRWGAINARSVVEHPGARTGQLSLDQIHEIIDANPTFEARRIPRRSDPVEVFAH